MIMFKHTLKQQLNIKNLVIYLTGVSTLYLFFYHLFAQVGKTTISYYEQLDLTSAGFFIITFMWTLGIPFLFYCAYQSVQLIQQEIEEQTLCVLISKPISRLKLLGEKLFATCVSMFLIGVMSLFLNLTLMVFIFPLSSSILLFIWNLLPSLILYTAFISFVVNTCSLILSLIFNHRLKALIFIISLIIITELILPLFKGILVATGIYQSFHLYYLDFNYQLGLIFYKMITLFSHVHFSPLSQQFINQYIGIFNNQSSGIDRDLGFFTNPLHLVTYFHSVSLFICWLLVGLLSVFFSYRLLKRKDLQ